MKSRVFIKIASAILGVSYFSGVVLAAPVGPQLVIDKSLNRIEGTEWASQIKDMENEIATIKNFSSYNVQDEIKNLSDFLNQSSNIGKNFNTYHPGYVASDSNTDNSALVKQTIGALQDSVSSLSSNVSESTSSKETDNINTMEEDAKHASGATQAAQAEAELTSAEIGQLQLLRQAVLAESSAQMATESYEVQKDASSQATQDKIIDTGSSNLTGNFGGDPLITQVFH